MCWRLLQEATVVGINVKKLGNHTAEIYKFLVPCQPFTTRSCNAERKQPAHAYSFAFSSLFANKKKKIIINKTKVQRNSPIFNIP